MAPSFRCRRPLRGAVVQSVAWRHTRENFRRSTYFSSPNSSETDFDTVAPQLTNPRATPAQGPTPAPAPAPTDDFFRQFKQAYMEYRCQPAPAAALVEPQEDILDWLLKAQNPGL